ncbi:MAG: DUF5320 domain-containing protein [Candidatus Aminicenantes bacterium]
MPGGDRTGPSGMGPMTGRRMGYCAGYGAPGFMNPGPGYGMGRRMGFGRGFGRGPGFGRGRGWWHGGYGGFWGYPHQALTKEDEVAYLENEAKEVKEELNQIKARLEELKKSKKQSEQR